MRETGYSPEIEPTLPPQPERPEDIYKDHADREGKTLSTKHSGTWARVKRLFKKDVAVVKIHEGWEDIDQDKDKKAS